MRYIRTLQRGVILLSNYLDFKDFIAAAQLHKSHDEILSVGFCYYDVKEQVWRCDARKVAEGGDTKDVDETLLNELIRANDNSIEGLYYDYLPKPSFQTRVWSWLLHCFGWDVSSSQVERCHRFYEEATELVQALDYTEEQAHAIVRYVYARKKGEVSQEVGGVKVSFAALCAGIQVDMDTVAERELKRCWANVEKIRNKQAQKPEGISLTHGSK